MTDVVCALIVDGSRILMGKRSMHLKRPGMWEHPGGKVEAGEDHAQALRRELQEELHISGIRIDLFPVSVASLFVELDLRIHLYRVHDAKCLSHWLAHSEVRWVEPLYAIENLPCVPSVYAFYRDILREML